MTLPDQPAYEQILDQADRLAPADKLCLLQGLVALLRQDIESPPDHSITELRGLGKENWNGMDAQEYVDQERMSWDG
jgi:hypothetical protein